MTESVISNSTVALTAELVACDSTNPDLGAAGPGEAGVAAIIGARLLAAGLEVVTTEPVPGRPNVIGRLPGRGGGRSLMLSGHMDVVAGEPDQFSPRIEGNRLYGRGSVDMKAGLAAAIIAAERIAAGPPLAGDLLVAAVIDEEWLSLGTEDLLRDWRADAAIVTEQSDLEIYVEHGGFAWFELESRGVEAAGVDPDRGVDAIGPLAGVLLGLTELDRELATRRPVPGYGRPSIHPATIAGGTQLPAYAARCRLGIERCTVFGETVAGAQAEIEAILERAAAADPRLDAELRLIVGREPVRLDESGPLVRTLHDVIERHVGRAPRHLGEMGWGDSGLFAEAGIPCVNFGPAGGGHHTADEFVELDSLVACTEILVTTARAFCGS